eukprot:10200001-Alexandrium_andersonii.AAC.1
MAWRSTDENPKDFDFAATIAPQEDDTKPCIAAWSDGMTHEIEGLLSLTWRTRAENDKNSSSGGKKAALFTGKSASGAQVHVRVKSDRVTANCTGELIVVFEGKKQVGQVKVQPDGEQAKCISIATKLAEEYCQGTLAKDSFNKRRAELLSEIGGKPAVSIKSAVAKQRSKVKKAKAEGAGAPTTATGSAEAATTPAASTVATEPMSESFAMGPADGLDELWLATQL